jgi:hypothetical protein
VIQQLTILFIAQQLMHEHIFVAEDYQQLLADIESRQQFQKIDRIVQFPFSPPVRLSLANTVQR